MALCHVAQREGARTLVATPHVNSDYPGVNAEVIVDRTEAVNRALRASGIELSVRTGAEIGLSRAGELSELELDELTLGGGRSVLIELPWTSAISGAMGALRALAGRGYGIVLAHPERSPLLQRDGALVAELVDWGMLCCIDAASLTHRAERRVRSMTWRLLANGLVHVIASDCHDAVERPPQLRSVLEQAGFDAAEIDYFIREAPEAILAGDAVAAPPVVRGRHRPRRLPRRPW